MTLLIDGHNLLGTGLVPGVQLGDTDDEWLLVQRLRTYAAARRQAMTVVFDSGLAPAPRWQLSGGGVTVRFASPGVEADAVIVQLLRADPQPGQITVVTNDQGLASLVRAAGGQVRSATQFATQFAPHKSRMPSLAEPPPDPRAPGFADIYQGFVAVEKDQVRFGAEIDLDAANWIERLYGDDLAEASPGRALAGPFRWRGRPGAAAGRAQPPCRPGARGRAAGPGRSGRAERGAGHRRTTG